LADGIVGYIETVPTRELSSEPVQRAFSLGEKVASVLPETRALDVRTALRNLGIQVIDIKPIPHAMVFDTESFTVRAGQAVEIRFENTDIMPHNLVVTVRGALSKVGQAAEVMALEPGAEHKDYVPEMPEVLHATSLLYPGQNQRLAFTAPTEPGDYPFVCTFPGHWILMNGIMRVVETIDADTVMVARRETSEAHAHSEMRAFVKMWTLQDLLPKIANIQKGRSFAKGKALFESVGCNKCHTFAGEGLHIGPELTTISEKYNGIELLQHILNPSDAVEPEYTSYFVETSDFMSYTGLLAAEDADAIQLRANPLDPEDITTIPRGNIDSIDKSTLSAMPTGMLTTLRQDEIYDLIAFLLSGGDEQAPAFVE
jgi:putative heme-binding domain-containing protein